MEELFEPSYGVGILDDAFPARRRPWPAPIGRQGFEQVEKIGLKRRMRANQHGESINARRRRIEGVATHDAPAQLLEDLRGLGGNELLEFALERLDGKFRAQFKANRARGV